ncbi:MAG: hypothetical protein BWY65_00778 [Firmicutes bacterium ADurb.Bin373]|nr:MAG: hypothetical protein BWY65_00778 [Firmicutes bacterium ADurb.Bin373]
MPTKDEIKHDLLLTITVALAILFATGISGPSTTPGEPVVLP